MAKRKGMTRKWFLSLSDSSRELLFKADASSYRSKKRAKARRKK